MSIQTEITRLQGLRNTLRTKLTALGLVGSTADLQACVTAVQGLADNGAVSKTLDATTDNQSYTGPGGTEITESEYNALLSEIRTKAALVDKLYNGEITIDAVPVEWQEEIQRRVTERQEAEQAEPEETELEDAIAALNLLGVEAK